MIGIADWNSGHTNLAVSHNEIKDKPCYLTRRVQLDPTSALDLNHSHFIFIDVGTDRPFSFEADFEGAVTSGHGDNNLFTKPPRGDQAGSAHTAEEDAKKTAEEDAKKRKLLLDKKRSDFEAAVRSAHGEEDEHKKELTNILIEKKVAWDNCIKESSLLDLSESRCPPRTVTVCFEGDLDTLKAAAVAIRNASVVLVMNGTGGAADLISDCVRVHEAGHDKDAPCFVERVRDDFFATAFDKVQLSRLVLIGRLLLVADELRVLAIEKGSRYEWPDVGRSEGYDWPRFARLEENSKSDSDYIVREKNKWASSRKEGVWGESREGSRFLPETLRPGSEEHLLFALKLSQTLLREYGLYGCGPKPENNDQVFAALSHLYACGLSNLCAIYDVDARVARDGNLEQLDLLDHMVICITKGLTCSMERDKMLLAFKLWKGFKDNGPREDLVTGFQKWRPVNVDESVKEVLKRPEDRDVKSCFQYIERATQLQELKLMIEWDLVDMVHRLADENIKKSNGLWVQTRTHNRRGACTIKSSKTLLDFALDLAIRRGSAQLVQLFFNLGADTDIYNRNANEKQDKMSALFKYVKDRCWDNSKGTARLFNETFCLQNDCVKQCFESACSYFKFKIIPDTSKIDFEQSVDFKLLFLVLVTFGPFEMAKVFVFRDGKRNATILLQDILFACMILRKMEKIPPEDNVLRRQCFLGAQEFENLATSLLRHAADRSPLQLQKVLEDTFAYCDRITTLDLLYQAECTHIMSAEIHKTCAETIEKATEDKFGQISFVRLECMMKDLVTPVLQSFAPIFTDLHMTVYSRNSYWRSAALPVCIFLDCVGSLHFCELDIIGSKIGESIDFILAPIFYLVSWVIFGSYILSSFIFLEEVFPFNSAFPMTDILPVATAAWFFYSSLEQDHSKLLEEDRNYKAVDFIVLSIGSRIILSTLLTVLILTGTKTENYKESSLDDRLEYFIFALFIFEQFSSIFFLALDSFCNGSGPAFKIESALLRRIETFE